MNLGGDTTVKAIYTSPVVALSGVPDGLSIGDLVAVAAQSNGIGVGHAANGIYSVASGGWSKLVANASTRYLVRVGASSTTGGNPLTDGLYVMYCSDMSAAKYLFKRITG